MSSLEREKNVLSKVEMTYHVVSLKILTPLLLFKNTLTSEIFSLKNLTLETKYAF